ncbi:MAG: DegV family protein [Anaerolineaceae bacterium]|nr:DegV family protein [Anaerolineaceae bacterium]
MIRIIADTTCSLPLETLAALGIDTIPQIIIIGEDSYRDDTEIDSPTFLRMLKTSPILPKTAAPPPYLYLPLFEKYSKLGDTILVITPSSEVSGTFSRATIASEEFPDADIHIIDSRTLAGGLGSIILQAHKWVQEGIPIDILKTAIKEMASRERVYFLVDTLEYLHKGGRIGKAEALFGSLLQIKPILTLDDGKVSSFDKQRTTKHALNAIRDLIIDHSIGNPNPNLSISQIAAEETALKLKSELMASLKLESIPIYRMPPAIIVHAGPGVLSLSCFIQ